MLVRRLRVAHGELDDEAVAVGRTIEGLEREKAKMKQAEQADKGALGKEHGQKGGRGKKKPPLDDSSKGGFGKYATAESNRTTGKVAKSVGMGRIAYERANTMSLVSSLVAVGEFWKPGIVDSASVV